MLGKYVCTAFVLILLVSAGCASVSERQKNGQAEYESINPFEYGDEFAENGQSAGLPGESGETMNSGPSAGMPGGASAAQQSASPEQPESANLPASPYGYRIQVGIYDTKADADAASERAGNRLDQPVTITFEAPFYRVRTGRFSSRTGAEDYLATVKRAGFRDAIILRTSVNEGQ